ncbi:APC family permease [Thermosinus carboxydivorans]|nr:APC family permease [Thermosinus carboxydivorans]
MMREIRRLLIGRPLHNQELSHEKLPKWKALAIFSSDALSSVGYGPEQIMLMLAVPGVLAYGYIGPVAFAILVLLAIVTVSYVQVAKANPGGGGSYSVAITNLGELPALTAAAALFADYSLTVAVSISSGTEAIVSAFPQLVPHALTIDLAVLFGILMLINLRGVRESSNVFVFPTYAFILGMLGLIAAGVYQAFTQPAPLIPPASAAKQWDWAVAFLILRAFASGCSSMTGIEAISNGVPMFKKPEIRNATITTYWMSAILAVMFAGISFLIMHYHIMPVPDVTALSQVAELTFGRNWAYYYVQFTTMLVLYLAANTAYNGLPPLLSILAKDGYMPRYLGARGERLSFSNGIILLSVIAGLLITIFHGNTEHLISLYAIGVFLSFTIAQVGMVVYWRREKSKGWTRRAILNGVGAIVTGTVVLVIAITKFFYGAWLVLIFIPTMIYIFKKVRHHYNDMSEQLQLPPEYTNPASLQHPQAKNLIIVPVASITRVVAQSLQYAKTLSPDILAVHIATDDETGRKFKEKWEKWNPDIRLVIIYSPYRLVIKPLLDYIEQLERTKAPSDFITVLIPEFETKKWWHRLLHNQTGWVLRTLLILKENVIVATIPYHLQK